MLRRLVKIALVSDLELHWRNDLLVYQDLFLVIFSSFDVAANWPSNSVDETPPNNLGYMNLVAKSEFALKALDSFAARFKHPHEFI